MIPLDPITMGTRPPPVLGMGPPWVTAQWLYETTSNWHSSLLLLHLRGIKPPKSWSSQAFREWRVPRGGLRLLGRLSPRRQRSTAGKNADASKSSTPSGGRLCPPDYFWLVFLNYGGTDLWYCRCCHSAVGIASSQSWKEGCVRVSGDR